MMAPSNRQPAVSTLAPAARALAACALLGALAAWARAEWRPLPAALAARGLEVDPSSVRWIDPPGRLWGLGARGRDALGTDRGRRGLRGRPVRAGGASAADRTDDRRARGARGAHARRRRRRGRGREHGPCRGAADRGRRGAGSGAPAAG